MSFDLTNKNISDTFQNLLQKTGSGNQLYDLVGNPIKDLTIQGSLIAESYIVSQSTTVHSSGSTAFGNSSDDTHNFIGSLNTTGNITASGDISASGDIYLENNQAIYFRGSDGVIDQYIQAGSNYMRMESDNAFWVRADNYVNLTTPLVGVGTYYSEVTPPKALTVEGDISSSGDIETKGGTIIGGGGEIIVGQANSDGILLANNSQQTFVIAQGDNDSEAYLTVTSDKVHTPIGSKMGLGNPNPRKALTVEGDISASNFIFLTETGSSFQGTDGTGAGYLFASSSGQLCYQSGSTQESVIALGTGGGGSSDNLGNHTATEDLNLDGNNIYNIQHITSSGNISASGDIIASKYIGDSYTVSAGSIADQNLATFITNDTIMSIASANKKTQINGTNIKLDAPITASGTIFVSGSSTVVSSVYNRYADFGLVIKNGSDTLDTFAGIAFDVSTEGNDDDAVGAAIKAINMDSTATIHETSLAFFTNNHSDDDLYERMRINDDGQVSIATKAAAPNMELTVSGSISSSREIYSSLGFVGKGDSLDFEVTSSTETKLVVDGVITSSGEFYANNQLVVSGSGDVLSGYHGSQTRIKLMARDFHIDDNVGRPLFIYDDDLGSNELSFRSFSTGDDVYATVDVPVGFKATHVMVYGSDTSNDVWVYEGNINTATVALKSPSSQVVGTEINITDVVSTDTNFLWIRVNLAAGSDLLYGGYVTIEQL